MFIAIITTYQPILPLRTAPIFYYSSSVEPVFSRKMRNRQTAIFTRLHQTNCTAPTRRRHQLSPIYERSFRHRQFYHNMPLQLPVYSIKFRVVGSSLPGLAFGVLSRLMFRIYPPDVSSMIFGFVARRSAIIVGFSIKGCHFSLFGWWHNEFGHFFDFRASCLQT